MATPNIQEVFRIALHEQGFCTHQKKNGDIMFWKDFSFKMSISFTGKQGESFIVKALVGTLSNDDMIRIGKACCIETNFNLYVARLVVEKEGNIYGLYVRIDYSCYSASEVYKFVSLMNELLIVAYISASSYMRDKLGI